MYITVGELQELLTHFPADTPVMVYCGEAEETSPAKKPRLVEKLDEYPYLKGTFFDENPDSKWAFPKQGVVII